MIWDLYISKVFVLGSPGYKQSSAFCLECSTVVQRNCLVDLEPWVRLAETNQPGPAKPVPQASGTG